MKASHLFSIFFVVIPLSLVAGCAYSAYDSNAKSRSPQSMRPKMEAFQRPGKKSKEKKDEKEKSPKVWKRDKKRSGVAELKVGTKEKLSLTNLRVMVKVDGLRVRTIVDHIFYNDRHRQLEGTFRYRLPDRASIGYFAFAGNITPPRRKDKIFIGDPSVKLPTPSSRSLYEMGVEEFVKSEKFSQGKTKVARVVPKEQALHAYESVVRKRVDPALVKWAGGNVFSTRVYPIMPRGFCRIVIAYDQTLPRLGNKCRYEFRLPTGEEEDNLALNFTLLTTSQMASKGKINQKVLRKKEKDGLATYHFRGQLSSLSKREVEYLYSAPPVEVISGKNIKEDPLYVYGRITPDLPEIEKARGASKAVFIVDTSYSQKASEFDIYLKLLREILKKNSEIKYFNLLFFNVETTWGKSKGWIENTPSMRKKVFSRLKELLLEGATDIDSALQKLNRTDWVNQKDQRVDVFWMSNGQGTWGDPNLPRIISRFKKNMKFSPRFYAYNLGLGTFHQQFFDLLKGLGGSTFHCYGPGQISSTAVAHKRVPFEIEKMEGVALEDLLVSGHPSLIYPGQSVIFAARASGKSPRIQLKGRFQGKKKELAFDLPLQKNQKKAFHLAPRAYGEMAVKLLESRDNPELKETIIAYSRRFGVPGKTCSLLMLESKADYQRFQVNLKKDYGKVRKREVSKVLQKVAHSLSHSLQSEKNQMAAFWESILQNPRVKIVNKNAVSRLLALIPDDQFEVAKKEITTELMVRGQVPGDYLSQRESDSQNPQTYLDESERRLKKGKKYEALRCLSTLIEINPHSSQAMRIVAYWLLQKGLPSVALDLFKRVRDLRPFEPHSYRDMAKCYKALGKMDAAALYYEIALAGNWHSRFARLDTLLREEYSRLLTGALKRGKFSEKVKDFALQRQKYLGPTSTGRADIVVTITWNTDNTDVDLWVVEPDGEECGYSNPTTDSGGQLLKDITQGYGPERYRMTEAPEGKYEVAVKYFASNVNRLSDRTFVECTVTFYAGTSRERSRTFFTLLSGQKERTVLYKFDWPPR